MSALDGSAVIRHTGRFLLSSLLATALTAIPIAARAQGDVAPAAMVEQDPSVINTWGFGASVPVGGSVTWTNMGKQAHTVTADDGSFDSGLVDPGADTTIEFDTPGIFSYICSEHPTMKGFVSVSADATDASPMAMVEGNPTNQSTWGFAVSVAAGQTIEWTNVGTQAHTATASNGSFDTGLVASGATGQVQFNKPGIFAYICTPHPWMKGIVAVN